MQCVGETQPTKIVCILPSVGDTLDTGITCHQLPCQGTSGGLLRFIFRFVLHGNIRPNRNRIASAAIASHFDSTRQLARMTARIKPWNHSLDASLALHSPSRFKLQRIHSNWKVSSFQAGNLAASDHTMHPGFHSFIVSQCTNYMDISPCKNVILIEILLCHITIIIQACVRCVTILQGLDQGFPSLAFFKPDMYFQIFLFESVGVFRKYANLTQLTQLIDHSNWNLTHCNQFSPQKWSQEKEEYREPAVSAKRTSCLCQTTEVVSSVSS